MKLRTTIAAGLILLTAIGAQATPVLVDLIPGGWNQTEPITPQIAQVISEFNKRFLFADINNGEWIDWILHGPDYFSVTDSSAAVAQVQWDMSGTTYYLAYISVLGINEENEPIEDIYRVSPTHRNGNSGGFVPVTLDGQTRIQDIAFVGRVTAPDGGTTVALLGAAMIGIVCMRRYA